MATYNIYCDESCHLEHDDSNVMILGAIYCPQVKLKEINRRIRQIKQRNQIPLTTELKWTKVSPSKLDVYADLINYFFDDDDLHFRALIVPDKSKLDHSRFRQSHDEWYYKMYFDMLKHLLNPSDHYEIYIDIKDTHSYRRAQKLRDVCCNSMYDFSHSIIKRIQPIRSDEVEIMQLVDLLIGAIGYHNRNFPANTTKSLAKQKLIDLIIDRSGYKLNRTTLLREDKCNLFFWEAR